MAATVVVPRHTNTFDTVDFLAEQRAILDWVTDQRFRRANVTSFMLEQGQPVWCIECETAEQALAVKLRWGPMVYRVNVPEEFRVWLRRAAGVVVLRDDVQEWLDENIPEGRRLHRDWGLGWYLLFPEEKDVIAFMLRWG